MNQPRMKCVGIGAVCTNGLASNTWGSSWHSLPPGIGVLVDHTPM